MNSAVKHHKLIEHGEHKERIKEFVRLVVFDLDHTLLKANSSFHFGRYLYQQHYFSFWTLLVCLSAYARHKWCGMSASALHHYSFVRLFKGRSQEEIHSHVTLFLQGHLSNLLNQPVVSRLRKAQRAGNQVLILSSSPDFLVGEIANRLSVERWKATSYAVDRQHRYCGISHVMEGEEKARFVAQQAEHLSLPLSAVTAYSDSMLDMPILKLVGQPICVGPNHRLTRICRQNGWEMINHDERWR